MRARGRVGAALALLVMAAFIGVGVALLGVAGALTLSGAALGAMGDGRSSLRAPGVALALSTELIAAALLLGWSAGGRRSEGGEDHGPVLG